jgi:hypothetical protein
VQDEIGSLRLTGGLLLTGDVDALRRFLDRLPEILAEFDLKLIYKTFSGDRLRIVREAELRSGTSEPVKEGMRP